jgi:hypothetical protein
MLKNKILSGLCVLIIVMVVFTGSGMALTSAGLGNDSSPSTTKILKVVGLVKMVTATTLYLENKKKYSLTDVKVIDKTYKYIPGKKKKAEMIFVNDVLKEVSIYY